MAYKIAISKATKNVLTETDPDNLIFSSDYNTLKYHASGDQAVVIDCADYYDSEVFFPFGTWYYHRKEETIAHGLGYVPYFTSYVDVFAGGSNYNMCPGTFVDFLYYYYAYAYADATNIYLVVEGRNDATSGTVTFNFAYKIFRNKLNI